MNKMRCFQQLKNDRFKDCAVPTITSEEQIKVEESVERMFDTFVLRMVVDQQIPKLLRWKHISFLKSFLSYVPGKYAKLDASRAWLCYWVTHGLKLLEEPIPSYHQTHLIKFLIKCQCPGGGFGGGPGQFAHLAPTYAAVSALCIIGTKEAYDAIDRNSLQRFLWSLRSDDGAFSMHIDGEVDIRGVYCALAVATLTNIYTEELFKNTAEWIASCQTYEGGFSGCPGMEAHGGYSFCGLASLILLNKGHICDKAALLRWTANRQMKYEGGFQGRTNKLVDSCYSFWQGATFPLLHKLFMSDATCLTPKNFLFNEVALQEYILICCQNPSGAIIDKPGKVKDVYHTCYGLSGLAISQMPLDGDPVVIGPPENQLEVTHPVYNICPKMVLKAHEYYQQLPVPIIKNTTS